MSPSMPPLSRLAPLGLALALAACGGSVVTPVPTADASTDTPPAIDAQTGCPLGNGTLCARGQSCPSPDGCNTCFCDQNGFLVCTARACVDAGPPGCASASDCRNGFEECYFPEGACGAQGRCGPITDCAQITPYCDCNGTTFMDCPGRPTRPNRGRGACSPTVDAGVRPDSAVCEGAAIHPISGCLGPADGPLPVECCVGWICDPERVACDSLPPTCPAGYRASVLRGCWGPCVPAENCARTL